MQQTEQTFSAMRSDLAAAHRQIICFMDQVQGANGNMHQDHFVRKTEMVSFVEEFER
jgi:hypothetical protein